MKKQNVELYTKCDGSFGFLFLSSLHAQQVASMGLELVTLTSQPEVKSRVELLTKWVTQAPQICFFK